MARLKLRTLVLRKKPYGKFNYKILLDRRVRKGSSKYITTNASLIEKMRDLLRDTCQGSYKLDYEINYKNRRVYNALYLENGMDLAMIKLVHPDKLYKIYKIKVLDVADESLDQTESAA